MGPDDRPTEPSPEELLPVDAADLGREAASTLRLDDQLCFAVCTAANAVVRAYRPLLSAIGLTHPQYLVLMALWEQDGVSLSHLAARLELPLHGLSPVAERLERSGLVRRRRDPPDRRVVRLELTGAGRDLEAAAAEAQHEVVRQSHLTPTALEQLRGALDELSTNLSGRGR